MYDTPYQYAQQATVPSQRPSGRPRETVNGRCAADYIKRTYGLRTSSEVKAWAMTQRSTCPKQGNRMCQLLDRAAEEARRSNRKTILMKDLHVALSFEEHGMSPYTPVQPPPDTRAHQPVVAYDSQGQEYAYYPATEPRPAGYYYTN